jgi:hypothetical protein
MKLLHNGILELARCSKIFRYFGLDEIYKKTLPAFSLMCEKVFEGNFVVNHASRAVVFAGPN